MSGRKKRRLDQALHDRAKRLAETHPLGAVATILRLHPSQITRMKKRNWQAAAEGAAYREAPDDLEARQASMTFAELCAHYQAGNSTVSRWLKQLARRRPSWRGDALRSDPLRTPGRLSKEAAAAARARQWETRRARYGPSGSSKPPRKPSRGVD